MPMYERLQEQEEALYANTEPMLSDGNSNEVTKISRQCVETIQEEPKLKFINVVGGYYHVKSET